MIEHNNTIYLMTNMMKQIISLFFLLFLNHIQILICKTSEPDYEQYLQQFGYTPNLEGRLFSVMGHSPVSEGIKKFQRLFKLPETGQLDDRTKRLMQRKRCGNPDIGTIKPSSRSFRIDKLESSPSNRGRFSNLQSPSNYEADKDRWSTKDLKWFIEEYPKQQKQIKSHADIRRIMKQAFDDWEKFSGLKFEMVDNKESAHLKIKFSSKSHGDDYPFDGPGVTLAHAFYPENGDIHFDDDESFTDDYNPTNEQYTLRLVAAHEIGHALGLPHIFEEDSLMFPTYQQFASNYNISKGDQDEIQKLYGNTNQKPNIETTKSTLSSTIPTTYSSDLFPNNYWCQGEFQTGCEGPDGALYLFKDDQVWRYRNGKNPRWDAEPQLINRTFASSLTNAPVTACVKSTTGYTYLFRDSRIWKLKTHWDVDGPHRIKNKKYPENPRITLFHQNFIYLLRDRVIYRLNEFDYDKNLESDRIDAILHPPPNEYIQAGFTYAKRHYIFTRNEVYVYDSTYGNLLAGYPKPATTGWFACEKLLVSSHGKKRTTTTARYRQDHEQEHHRHHQHHRHHHHDDDEYPPPRKYPHRQRHRHHHHYDD